ncbi:MAG: hypothetical protein LBB34_01685, partial [Holosporales bacterium]|nr:hypothetical protein [Holosporales bacterium]
MPIQVGNFRKFWDFYKVSFLQSSVLYKFSLSRQHDIFDTTKFITDPWRGDSHVGKAILDDNTFAEGKVADGQHDIFQSENSYMATFAWIRDLQAIGGNNSRKYARNLVAAFIRAYRQRKNFWLNDDFKDCGVIGERIVNWIFSYSFFASGVSDKFQKEVLSSISEQSSHLLKCYKAEFNMYRRLMALKAILLYFCVMKKSEFRKIKKIVEEINNIVTMYVDNQGIFRGRCPINHFHIFRSLLEIRFMTKILDVNYLSNTFGDILS